MGWFVWVVVVVVVVVASSGVLFVVLVESVGVFVVWHLEEIFLKVKLGIYCDITNFYL